MMINNSITRKQECILVACVPPAHWPHLVGRGHAWQGGRAWQGACVAGAGMAGGGGMRGGGGGMLATFSVPLKPSKGMFISPVHKQWPAIVTTWDSREDSSCLSDRLKQTVLLVTCVTLHFNNTQISRSTKGVSGSFFFSTSNKEKCYTFLHDIYCYTFHGSFFFSTSNKEKCYTFLHDIYCYTFQQSQVLKKQTFNWK